MVKYIDADALKKTAVKLENESSTALEKNAYNLVQMLIEDAPPADVAPVVHGRWIVTVLPGVGGFRRTIYSCSLCGRSTNKEPKAAPYCRCGALMDGEEGAE